MSQRVRRFSLVVAAVLAVPWTLSATGCKRDKQTAEPPDPTMPARRAAQAWIHCLEQNGGACVKDHSQLAAWDAYAILGWLATGSPTSILSGLRRELQHHTDSMSVQRRMVAVSDTTADELRGAECRGVDALPFEEVLPKLKASAEARMDYFGIKNDQMGSIIDGLNEEASAGLMGGYFVTMECVNAPYVAYVATAPNDDHFVVAGMMMELPRYLGGVVEARDRDTGQLLKMRMGDSKQTSTSSMEGTVHPWINVFVEEF